MHACLLRFQHSLQDGWHQEQPDHWLRHPDPWEVARPHERGEVTLHGSCEVRGGTLRGVPGQPSRLLGIPCDRPVGGYSGKTLQTLRRWSAAVPRGAGRSAEDWRPGYGPRPQLARRRCMRRASPRRGAPARCVGAPHHRGPEDRPSSPHAVALDRGGSVRPKEPPSRGRPRPRRYNHAPCAPLTLKLRTDVDERPARVPAGPCGLQTPPPGPLAAPPVTGPLRLLTPRSPGACAPQARPASA
jgi:Carbohydrate phosphorylase